MSLTTGTRLGQYEITDKLGEGGMGEVYKARDTRLQRSVAIKILPELFASDPERLARFEREAQVLASLNHTNIAHIYGVEESGGVLALVMELVDGPTLAQVIAQHGPVTSAKASHASRLDIDRLDIARQLADALEAAHEQGIIHRDLKPQNVILRADGTLKVLDFGLAKALDPVSRPDRSDNSPTITNAATRVGTLLGTAAYMAPEQVKGRAADRRADIWAFGAVLYELWTGTMAFGGETVTETLAKVIEREPDWTKLPADTPPAVVRLLRRTLIKDPKHRLQSIGDARLELEDTTPIGAAPADAGASRRGMRWSLVALALASGLALGFAYGRLGKTGTTPAGDVPLRAAVPLPPGTILDGSGPPEVALSPDGSTLAFVARTPSGLPQLYVRGLASESAALIPGSETAEGPFFSPDGRWIGFAVGTSLLGPHAPELRKYSLDTGLTQTIASVIDYFGGFWREDGTIVFVNQQPSGLWEVDSNGGKPRQILPRPIIDGKELELPMSWPIPVPGTTSVLLTDWSRSVVGDLMALDLATSRGMRLGLAGSGPQLLPNGYLVYANDRADLMGVKFDTRSVRVTGTPTALLPDIAFARGNVPVFAVAANGTLAFATGFLRFSRREPMQLMRISAAGAPTALSFQPELLTRGFAVSLDGTQLAAGAWDGSRWIFDLKRGTRRRIAPGILNDILSLSWHPDGRHIAVGGPLPGSGAWAIKVEALDEAAVPQTVMQEPTSEVFTAGWFPGGQSHLGWTSQSDGAVLFRVDRGQPKRTIHLENTSIRTARISPDGRWAAFDSAASGQFHVYVTTTDGKGRPVQASVRPGDNPRWSPDGRRLLFRSGNAIYTVDVKSSGGEPDFGAERKLFDVPDLMAREYDVAPNGDIYTLFPAADISSQNHIQLRTRWFEEVDRLLRGK